MRTTALRYAALFVVGAVTGTAYDYIHVAYGVLSYANPDFHGTSLKFVPVEFGLASIGGGLCILRLTRHLKAPLITLSRTVADAFFLAAAYVATGLLCGHNDSTAAVLTVITVVSLATRARLGRRFAIVSAVIAAFAGPACETSLSALGIFHYNIADPIPYWLPLLWMIASGAFVDAALLALKPSETADTMK